MDKTKMGKAVLLRSKAVFIEYLYQKIVAEDWHGVSDVANDLRELEIRLEMVAGEGINLQKYPAYDEK